MEFLQRDTKKMVNPERFWSWLQKVAFSGVASCVGEIILKNIFRFGQKYVYLWSLWTSMQTKLSTRHFWENCFVLCYKKPSLTVSETKKANLKIDRGKSWLGHFLFVFHDWDWLDNLVGRGPHAWLEKVQSHGNYCRDESGISAEIVSGKGLG